MLQHCTQMGNLPPISRYTVTHNTLSTTAVTSWYVLKQCFSTSNFFFFFFFFFNKVFLSDTFTCPILGPLVPLFWISGDVSSGFQSQSGFCLIRIAEANVMYIPWDPPLVLHVADLLTDSIAGRRLGSYLASNLSDVNVFSLRSNTEAGLHSTVVVQNAPVHMAVVWFKANAWRVHQ